MTAPSLLRIPIVVDRFWGLIVGRLIEDEGE
jgi:hypothetical protein